MYFVDSFQRFLQNFQSATNLVDSSANPSLFQSSLVIIVEDVLDSGTLEVVEECVCCQ